MTSSKRPPLIIGFVGKRGCGKDACSKYVAKKYRAKEIVMSSFISEALQLFHIHPNRKSFPWFITKIRGRFGKGILARAVIRQIENNDSPMYLLNGIRIKREVEILREKFGKKFILVDIFCDDTIRFTRLKKREKRSKQKKDDLNISLQKFIKQEKHIITEIEIPAIEKKADYTIENNGTIKELFCNLDKLIKIYKK